MIDALVPNRRKESLAVHPTLRRHVRAALAGALALSLAVPATLAAQESDAGPPEGWVVRTDGGGHGGGDLQFVEMAPGWHITTGPAAILYRPDDAASGEFRVESEVFLFDPGRRNEAFGIFIGGSELDGADQAYTYFLIRRDGSTLVKRRDGAGTSTIRDWTPHDAVVTWEEREEGSPTAGNVLAVEAAAEELVFSVNGREVFRARREGHHVDGIVGLRVNHGLNLHFSTLEIVPGS